MGSNGKFKVIIGESMAEDGINLLRFSPNFDVVVLDKSEKEKLKREIKNAHAIVVRSGVKVTEELLSHAENLKIIGRAGAGYDNIDVDACSKRGIIVMIAPTGNTNGVVELAIGLMFALIRHIPKADKTMKEGVWAKKKLEGSELSGKSIGLIGLGKIGGRVGEICECLHMKVIALVKNKNKKRSIDFHGEFVDSLDELLPNVDFLSLHVPLTNKTKNLLGKKEFEMMKPGAFVINTSRGDVIDEGALYEALKSGKLGGAAIDVYSEEPASKEKFPFIELDNVVAIPHLGASTMESQANVSRIICENIMEALKSGIYIDAVNLPFEIPASRAADYRPFIKLANGLGSLTGQYLDTEISEIKIKYRMSQILDFTPILMSLCREIFHPINHDISLINVKDYIEKQKIGLIISQEKDLSYDNSLKLEVTCKDGYIFEIKGTFLAGVPKMVEIQKILLDVVLAGNMLIFRNMNVPGIVGKMGTLLGEKSINISEMHLGRTEVGGETKGAIITEEKVPESIIEELKNIEKVVGVKQVSLD